MVSALEAFAAAFALLFVIESVDRSQFIVIMLAGRVHHLPLLGACTLAFGILAAFAVTLGALVAGWVAAWVLGTITGLVLVGFGIHLLYESYHPHLERQRERVRSAAGFWGAFGVLFVSELADESQLIMAGIAATSDHPVATGIGGFLGLLGAAALGIFIGNKLVGRIPVRKVQRVAGLGMVFGGTLVALYALF